MCMRAEPRRKTASSDSIKSVRLEFDTHRMDPFSYSKTPFTCDIHSSSTTLPPVSISPDVHVGYSALSDSMASSSLINGDPTMRQYVQQQPLQHHLHGGSLPPPLIPVSHHQPSPPQIPQAEPHSPARSFSASSPGAPWWQLQHVDNTSCDQPAVHVIGPWSVPPLPVAARLSFTYPPEMNRLRHISPMSPTPSPLSALRPTPLPVSLLANFDTSMASHCLGRVCSITSCPQS